MLQPVYFFQFMATGVSMAFLSPYLRGMGLSGKQIATVLASVPLLNMGMPLAWAWLADHTHRHARVLSVAALGAFAGFVAFTMARTFRGMLLGYFCYATFGVGIGALVDSIAIARVHAGADYGRLRVWGSIGFVVSSVGAGARLTARASRAADPLVPILIAGAFLGLFGASLQLRGTGEARARPRLADVRALLADRKFRLLLIVAPLHWIGCAPYNTFFGIFVKDRGLPPIVLGTALATGVVAEMFILMAFGRLHRRYGIETLLVVAFAGTSLRWALMPLVSHTAAVVGLQLFHGLTFGLFWGAGIALVGERVPPALRATGHSLFVVAMLGLGNVLGYWATGLIYDAAHSVAPAFLAASALELVPLALMLGAQRRARARAEPAA